MKWSAEKVKELRLRLGWSAAEFSRHFGCTGSVVLAWERGESSPISDDIRQLERLEYYLESYCEQLVIDPIAESALKQSGFSQIHSDLLWAVKFKDK